MKTATKFSFITTSIITALISSQANADIESGKNWLSTQNANNTNNSTIANLLQNQQETAQTLQLLQINASNNTDINQLLETESSTEGLVRIILLAHAKNQAQSTSSLTEAWQTLSLNQNQDQNEDGGFAHIQGWQSNPLDTAFVLIALHETNYLDTLNDTDKNKWQTRIAKALAYLASQQRTEGNYSIAHLDDLYTSSYVLSAITPYIKDYGQYIPTTQKLVAYLESKQVAPATWSTQENNKGLFLDALVAESLYPYQNSDDSANFAQAFEQRALSLQNSDGSWQEDSYVTALVLRAMDDLSKPAVSPITSSISLSVVDAETGLPLQGSVLTSSVTSPSKIEMTASTDGSFQLSDVNEGLYQFTLGREGYNTIVFEVRLKRGENLNIERVKLSRLPATSDPDKPIISQVQGIVTDKKTGLKLFGAQLTFTMIGDDGAAITNLKPVIVNTNAQGEYQALLPRAGKFTVSVSKEGFMPINTTATILPGQTALFSPKLTNESNFSVSVIGKVTDKNDQPLANTELLKDGQVIATTDLDGNFTITSTEQGNQIITIKKDGYFETNISLVITQPSQYDVGTIVLQENNGSNTGDNYFGNVNVSAQTVSGKSISGLSITAERINPTTDEVLETQTFSSSVEESISNLTLSVGQWKISVSHPAYQTSETVLDIESRVTATVNPTLALKEYSVSGRLVDSQTNLGLSDIEYKILDNDTGDVIVSGLTENDGGFAQTAITKSEIKIEFSPNGYLRTMRYISRNNNIDSDLDVGDIRVRPIQNAVMMPDLVVTNIDKSNMTTQQQSLDVGGSLEVTVTNKGKETLSKDFDVLVFEDKNNNRNFDDGEQVLST